MKLIVTDEPELSEVRIDSEYGDGEMRVKVSKTMRGQW